MAGPVCHCGFGEEYFTIEGNRSICTVCGGDVVGSPPGIIDRSAAEPGKRILVVDDQAFFRMRIRDILEPKQYQVVEANEGLAAVRRLSQALLAGVNRPADRVSLVILDLNMPGLIDGVQTLGVIKAMDEDLPVLILTSSAPTPELLRKLGQLKAKKYLNKSAKNLEDLLLRNIETL